ncbi:MAG TPA: hypothetical protein VNJ01_14260 [Bacteriovoracaceae bacterium]|nr:hypothetical protein [Bacteriovoracaceae bacterium]
MKNIIGSPGLYLSVILFTAVLGSTAYAQRTPEVDGTLKCVKELKRFMKETCYPLPWWQQPVCAAIAAAGYTGCVKQEAGPIVR